MPIFPQNPDPRSLTPRPADDLLSAGTRMGAVELLVADLDTMLAYYTDAVTLEVLAHAGDTAVLGRAGRTVLRLRQVPELPPARRGQAGLFHTAVLFEDEPALAAALASVAAVAPRSFTGPGGRGPAAGGWPPPAAHDPAEDDSDNLKAWGLVLLAIVAVIVALIFVL